MSHFGWVTLYVYSSFCKLILQFWRYQAEFFVQIPIRLRKVINFFAANPSIYIIIDNFIGFCPSFPKLFKQFLRHSAETFCVDSCFHVAPRKVLNYFAANSEPKNHIFSRRYFFKASQISPRHHFSDSLIIQRFILMPNLNGL